jgi:hypothetical protein
MVRIGLILEEDFHRTIDEVFEYLASQRNHTNGKSGWHQFLESGKIGNIATAQVLILHKQYDRPVPDVDSCLAWFEASRRQIAWRDKTSTGWSYLSSGPAVPCIEPTCWVYLAYRALGLDTDPVKQNVRTFLSSTKHASEHGVAWGFAPWTEPRVLPTCMGIRVLSRIEDQRLLDEAVRWLIAARNSQGAWGPTAKSEQSLTHTALAVTALIDAGYSSSNPIVRNGRDVLLEGLSKGTGSRQPKDWVEHNMSAFVEIVDIPSLPAVEDRPTRVQYHFNPLLLAAVALSQTSEPYLPYVDALAIEAIRSWKSIRWTHPFLGEHQRTTSWSIFDHLMLINIIRHRWFQGRNRAILYAFSSRGASLFQISRGASILHLLRSVAFRFLFRLITIVAVLLLLAHYILRGLDVKSTVLAIILGVISNVIYGYIKK